MPARRVFQVRGTVHPDEWFPVYDVEAARSEAEAFAIVRAQGSAWMLAHREWRIVPPFTGATDAPR